MPTRTHLLTDSPLGPLTLVRTEGRLSGLYMDGHRPAPPDGAFGDRVTGGFEAELDQLEDYLAGRRHGFDLPLAPEGTPFQRRVWELLRRIPYGRTRSYAQLAETLGNRLAVRAVAMANARNPISIVIPCHRVLGSDGSLTGYAGGIERKRFLLDLEGMTAA